MEEFRIFRIINRVNSILFLIFLLAGVGLVVFFATQANTWSNRGAVKVTEDPDDKTSPKIELVLGSVNELEGHEAQYVELRSKSRGGKFSSSYGGGETRNVLFLTGEQLESHWLFGNHSNYIKTVSPIKSHNTENKASNVITIFYEFVERDTNKNNSLDKDDLFSIALTKPNGRGFLIIEEDVSSVLDRTLSNNAGNLAILLQKEGAVYLKCPPIVGQERT